MRISGLSENKKLSTPNPLIREFDLIAHRGQFGETEFTYDAFKVARHIEAIAINHDVMNVAKQCAHIA